MLKRRFRHGITPGVIKPVPSLTVSLLAACVLAQGAFTPEQRAKLPAPSGGKIDFARDIQPILEASCAKCHARSKAKGGFNFDTPESFLKGGDSGPAALPGDSARSRLIELVSGIDPDDVMPLKGSKLAASQVGLLRSWIDQGMAWDPSINFAKPPTQNLHPRRPELPPAAEGRDNPIDRLLAPNFGSNHGVSRSPVDDQTFARRVHLDLLGLLPEAPMVESFLRDKGSNKRAGLVDKLLSENQRYAEHWLSFWNDLLRNDYRGTGYIDGGREQISSWLFQALAENKPYNRFVADLILPAPGAAGFTRGIVWRGAVNASQTPSMQAAQNVSQVFMGVNLKCASCHDSFINDWTLADAYSLANVFADEPLELFECDKPTGRKAGTGFIYPELGEIPANLPKAERTRRLADLMTRPSNGRLASTIVNRLWARFFGRGLVEPLDDMEQPAWNQDLLDWLASDLADGGYDLKRTIRWMLTSEAYQLPSVDAGDQPAREFRFAGPSVRRMTAEQYRDALGSLTGVWNDLPAFKIESPADSGKAAAKLPSSLKWIWSEPAAASRAPAERLQFRRAFMVDGPVEEAWAVATCDNSYTLYLNGARVVSGADWGSPNLADLKPYLRTGPNVLVVAASNHTSANQAPKEGATPNPADANPAGLMALVRLTTPSGVVDIATDSSWTWTRSFADGWEMPGHNPADARPAAELGGPGVAPWNVAAAMLRSLDMASGHAGEGIRASLVTADPLTVALGRPNREQVVTSRPADATTLQALELTNGATLSRLLKRGAEKLLAAQTGPDSALVSQIFLRALGRAPTPDELKLAEELLAGGDKLAALEDLLWSIAMLPEFQLIL